MRRVTREPWITRNEPRPIANENENPVCRGGFPSAPRRYFRSIATHRGIDQLARRIRGRCMRFLSVRRTYHLRSRRPQPSRWTATKTRRKKAQPSAPYERKEGRKEGKRKPQRDKAPAVGPALPAGVRGITADLPNMIYALNITGQR